MPYTHPAHSRISNRGFTLIEILVVIVIISISIGFVTVNFSSGSDEELAETEVLRIQQLLRFAHEQSVIRGEEYGVRFYSSGYRFLHFNEESETWEDLSNDKLLHGHTLEQPLELHLYIEQLPVDILESQDDEPEIEEKVVNADDNIIESATQLESKQDEIKPQVFLLSSSELTPQFEIHIRIPGSNVEETLQGLPQGEYKRVLPDE